MKNNDLYKKCGNKHTVHYRKKRKTHSFRQEHSSRKKHSSKRWIIFVACLALMAFFISILWIGYLGKGKNKLVGTWIYDDYTCYVFEESGHGELLADDLSYEYSYKMKGKKLEIDFTEDIIRDCNYTFSVDGSKLTLIGGTGTDGGTYTLIRVKK